MAPLIETMDPEYAHMLGRHEDERGFIEDLLGPTDSLTRIFTEKGMVRGNHIHEHTTQWVYVMWGKLLVVSQLANAMMNHQEYGPGMLSREDPNIPHAWRALETCLVLVFTRGPRAGENYEDDVIRLEVPLLL